MSNIIGLLNSLSASWGEMMLWASVTGGAVIAVLWAFCRLWPGMSPSGRSWLWRAAFGKLLLALCWGLSVGFPLLPQFLSLSWLDSKDNSTLSSASLTPATSSIPNRPGAFSLPLNPLPFQPQSKPTEKGSHVPPFSVGNGSLYSPSIEVSASQSSASVNLTAESVLLLFWFLGIGSLSVRAMRVWRLTRRWCAQSDIVEGSVMTTSLTKLC
jgi:hypothetical protein